MINMVRYSFSLWCAVRSDSNQLLGRREFCVWHQKDGEASVLAGINVVIWRDTTCQRPPKTNEKLLHSPRNHYKLQQLSGNLNEKQRFIGGWIPSVISDLNQVISSTSSESPIKIAFHFAIVFFVFKRHSNRKLNSNQQQAARGD